MNCHTLKLCPRFRNFYLLPDCVEAGKTHQGAWDNSTTAEVWTADETYRHSSGENQRRYDAGRRNNRKKGWLLPYRMQECPYNSEESPPTRMEIAQNSILQLLCAENHAKRLRWVQEHLGANFHHVIWTDETHTADFAAGNWRQNPATSLSTL